MFTKSKYQKRGFTLIELLAVIVILAIIALIATPIVLNIITNAKKSAAVDSAYGYIEAVESYQALALLREKDQLPQGTYNIEKTTTISGKEYQKLNDIVEIKGKKPTSGTVTIDSTGKVTSANLCVEGYQVTYTNKEVTEVKKGCSSSSSSSTTPTEPEPPTPTYTAYSVGDSINYNPVTGTINCENPTSTTRTKEGCMKWYVISASGANDTTVDVILDHNTTTTVAWNSNGSNASMGGVATALSTDTTGWTSGLNPRLITADEIAHIVGADSDSTIKWSSSKGYGTDDIENKSAWFYLDGGSNSDPTVYASGSNGWQKQVATSQGASNYAWLFDYTKGCTSNGCNTADSSNYGYWTSSPVSGTSNSAWFMNRYGRLYYDTVGTGNGYGVRPVITISKTQISS